MSSLQTMPCNISARFAFHRSPIVLCAKWGVHREKPTKSLRVCGAPQRWTQDGLWCDVGCGVSCHLLNELNEENKFSLSNFMKSSTKQDAKLLQHASPGFTLQAGGKMLQSLLIGCISLAISDNVSEINVFRAFAAIRSMQALASFSVSISRRPWPVQSKMCSAVPTSADVKHH